MQLDPLRRYRLTLSALVAFSLSTAPAQAEDTELFVNTAADAGVGFYPNVLFIVDTSGSMATETDSGATRMEVVQNVLNDYLDDLQDVNVGLMRFDSGYVDGGGDFEVDDFVEGGGMVLHAVQNIETARTDVKSTVNALTASGTTQLAETMYEAALYYMGEDVFFGLTTHAGNFWEDTSPEAFSPSVAGSRSGDTYISPLTQCAPNHIVYLTDGFAQLDTEANTLVPALPGFGADACTDNPDWDNGDLNVDGDGDCLDDVAAYLFENDLFGDEDDGIQNVITHTIGFFTESDLLEETAERGGGGYYLADDADTLADVLDNILSQVREIGTAFTSPGVSINAYDRTSHLDDLYFSVFQPTEGTHWHGNLKRYELGEPSEDGDLVVLDQTGAEAVNGQTGFFNDDAQSFWSSGVDGGEVQLGGAASQLTNSRRVLTTKPTGGIVAVHEDNTSVLSKSVLGIDNESDETLSKLLKWARGVDVKDEDGDGSFTDARLGMGDPMHSKPNIVTYGLGADEETGQDLVIFVGTNDGYLHAFNGSTGAEHFAFVPHELLTNLWPLYQNFTGQDKIYGIDGPLTSWVQDGGDGSVDSGDQVYLYFGLRRGGSQYYALDVSDLNNPTLLWQISPASSGFSQLGQTWSKPVVAKILTGSFGNTTEMDVLVFGGGYDKRQDEYSAHATDASGNAVFMVNANTGALVWSASSANSANTATSALFTEMNSSITGAIRVLDMNADGYADRLYAADLGGRAWRFDIHNPLSDGVSFNVTGGVLASLGGAADSTAASNRRFYYAPDVALGYSEGESFLNVTLASGYRAHPKETTINDFFYAVRDYKPFTVLGTTEDPSAEYTSYYGYLHTDLVDVPTQSTLAHNIKGMKMPMNSSSGEKVLAETRIFQNIASFTSYLPDSAVSSGSCYADLGSGKLYSVDLGTGAATSAILDKPGVPPEPIFVFTEAEDPTGDPDTCFGAHCTGYTPPDTDDGDGDDEDEEEDEDDGNPGDRQVGCLVGPTACDAGQIEAPVKTFWVQRNTDN